MLAHDDLSPRSPATPGTTRPSSRRARAALPLYAAGAGMVVREVSVKALDVVFVKGVLEASEGLASMFAERGGELLLAAPRGREVEVDELLADLEAELGVRRGWLPETTGAARDGASRRGR